MEFRNARYNKDGTIDCEVNHLDFGWLPYTASNQDVEAIGREVFEAAKNVASAYVDPPVDIAQLAIDMRTERNRRLREEVDPMVMNSLRWGDLTDEQRQAWADYRRALLDVTEQVGFPETVVWPARP